MNKSLLSTNNMITIFEWLSLLEQISWQMLSKKFFDEVIPMVMWRLKTFAFIGNKIVHYFDQESKNIFLYDVMTRH